MTTEVSNIKEKVRERYGSIAEKRGGSDGASAGLSCCDTSAASCCSPEVDIADTGLADFLYSNTDISDLPDTVTNVSLGCGNPTALASLKAGETVLDLGSGGGIDCFLASKAVGSEGYVIGVDMTDNMLALANENKAKLGISNVEFRKGEIEDLPVDDNSIDVIISNCVINLSPDKDAVFREAHRVLKPGGRFTVSDIVSEGEIPADLLVNIEAWTGCISGALDQAVYLEKLRHAGFSDVRVESRTSYGIEDISELNEASQETLKKNVDWSVLPDNARFYSADIVAYK